MAGFACCFAGLRSLTKSLGSDQHWLADRPRPSEQVTLIDQISFAYLLDQPSQTGSLTKPLEV